MQLANDLSFRGDGVAAAHISNGTYDSQHLDPNLTILITHLQQTEQMSTLSCQPTITKDDYVSKLAVWTETTTASPSGLHFGHYKALTAVHQYTHIVNEEGEESEDSQHQTEWNHMQTRMLQLHVQMLNYALKRG